MSTNSLPTSNHQITLNAAIEMTYRYRHNVATILNSGYSSALPLSETFNKEAFEPLFNNSACKGLRIYYGMNENLSVHAIIVGVNESNEDMLPAESLTNEDDEHVLLEDSQRCPPSCPPPSELNEDGD